jgi:GAF domain-containing protein
VPSAGERELALELAEVARQLVAADDVQSTLSRMVSLARETVTGCDHVGLSLAVGGRIETPAQTEPPIPQIIDRIQNETGEGPGVDAIRQHQVFETGDFSREVRWPRFSPAVVDQTQVHSGLAMRLFTDESTMGSLNLYAEAVDAFDDEDHSVASIFAAHAAIALRAALRQEQLTEAIATRDVIGQAKGILMARHGIDDDTAFMMLREGSQRMNRKLREVARRVIDHQPPATVVSPRPNRP